MGCGAIAIGGQAVKRTPVKFHVIVTGTGPTGKNACTYRYEAAAGTPVMDAIESAILWGQALEAGLDYPPEIRAAKIDALYIDRLASQGFDTEATQC
jgi:hypothetical protein